MDFFSLLWKLRSTSHLWVLAKELQFPHGSDSVLQKPSPVCLQLLNYGGGAVGGKAKEDLAVREEESLSSAELV